MTKELTCIICPKGCNIKVEYEKDIVKKIEGNTCKRGYDYALSEITNPVRTVTSTVKLDDGRMLSVKTDKPIPKNLISKCMKEINKITVKAPVKEEQIIIENVLNTGCNIIATKVM
jgi:CxxC motif-containing protein